MAPLQERLLPRLRLRRQSAGLFPSAVASPFYLSVRLVGCSFLTHFHSFWGRSPHPGVGLIFKMKHQLLLCLEVLVLYPPTFVHTRHTAGDSFMSAEPLRMPHCVFTHEHTHTL